MFGTPGTPTICWQTCLQLLWNHSWKHIRGVRNNHHCGKDRFQYKKHWRYGIYPINTNSKRVCNIRLGGVPKTMSLQRKNTWQFRRCRFQENDGSQPEINMFFFYTQIHTVEEILHQLLDGLFHVYIVAIQCRILSMRSIISHTIPFTHHSFVIDYHTQVPSNSHVDLIGAFNPSKKMGNQGPASLPGLRSAM